MAFFSQDFLYELQQRNDIVDVVSTYVEIKRKGGGKTYTGLCPFHNEKTPSFTVYPDSQSFYCFGCGAGGNVISFIEKRENLDFVETVKFLAVRAGMEIPDDGGAEVQSSRKRNYEANQLAARFFFDQLNTEEGREARAYLRRRGLTDATIKKFGMGYAPQGWDSLRDYLRSKGFHDEELVTFGLCARSQKGSVFDFFRNRVMFPVFDIRGKVIAFSGRRLHEEDSPRKYVNTIDTPVFKKSRNLFGLNFAKNNTDRTIVLAEGQMDAIAMHQAGVGNAVASLGTALTSEQVDLIAQYADRVIIAYDDDEAGHKATEKAIGLFKPSPLNVEVLSIKGAKDADEYIKKFGAESFRSLLEGSRNSVEYQLAVAANGLDLTTDAGRVAYLKAASEIIARSSSPVERDVYAGRVSEKAAVSKNAVLDQIESIRRQRARKQRLDEQRRMTDIPSQYKLKSYERDKLGSVSAENSVLYVLFMNPDTLPKIAPVIEEGFTDEKVGRIIRVLAQEIRENRFYGFNSLSTELGSEDVTFLAGMIANMDGSGSTAEDLDMLLDRIRKAKKKESKETIRAMDIGDIQKLIQKNGEK